ncbi:hypothetical protein [Ralstonia pseudosolanacearum]|uniref:hypothetical protein n=1 Tax=Ralstonia pseudosolanacearum TaxID=1310165 RepID=UPI003CEE0194
MNIEKGIASTLACIGLALIAIPSIAALMLDTSTKMDLVSAGLILTLLGILLHPGKGVDSEKTPADAG